jgi:hypothetical protein
VRAPLRRRVERLEAKGRATGERVRYAWWRAGEPRPEAQPGERLVVTRWADHGEGDGASEAEQR